jgi:hypothetical protein
MRSEPSARLFVLGCFYKTEGRASADPTSRFNI